jgi:hypothetical protein
MAIVDRWTTNSLKLTERISGSWNVSHERRPEKGREA